MAQDASSGDVGSRSPEGLERGNALPPEFAVEAPGAAGPAGREALARYDLGPEIARGGMDAVLEVWDRDLGRPLAMKVLLEKADEPPCPALVQRFVREARITGQLDHPGIVPVHEMGIDEVGRVFFTMRLVRGLDVGQVFEAGRAGALGWSRARALEVLLKICDTVAYAHSRGVVHRDLKPANVMVGNFGEVTVLDWGLARVIGTAEVSAEDDVDDSPLGRLLASDGDPQASRAGAAVGTPSYMAPEQVEGPGCRADRRLDVYSLGAMLYALLTGLPPYVPPGGLPISSRQLLAAVRRGPPAPVRDLAPEVPADLVALCERAMARDPDERFASAAEMAAALRAHQEDERKAADEARRLRDQVDDSRGVADFLKGLFRVETPADADKPVSMVEILARGAGRLDLDLAAQPAMRASVHATLGDVYNQIGAHAQAVPHFEDAVRAAREHLAAIAPGGAADATLAHRLTGLAQVCYEIGDYPRAEGEYQEAIAAWRSVDPRGEPLARAFRPTDPIVLECAALLAAARRGECPRAR